MQQAPNMGKNAEAPTMARLNTAPKTIVTTLSSGVCNPKDRLPDILIKTRAITKTATVRHAIWSVFKSLPAPNI